MPITVDTILKLPLFSSTTLIGGFQGVGREVLSANITDSPDIANWIRPNQFLLTTAYNYKDEPESLIPFLHQLNEHHCAGLAIKTKRYIHTLPEGLVQTANELGIPLIELPNNMLLGDVLNQILEHVLSEKQAELQRAFEVHQRFSNLFLKGATMSDIAQTLASLIKRPILILNASCETVGNSDSLNRRIQLTNQLPPLQAALKTYSFPENKVTAIPWGINEFVDVYPVHVSGINKGYICVMNSGLSPIQPLHIMPLEQASPIVAYEQMRQEALAEGEKRLRRQFFNDWLDNRLSKEEITNRAGAYGISDTDSYVIAICAADPSPEGRLAARWDSDHHCERWASLAEAFFSNEALKGTVCEVKDKRVVIMLPLLERKLQEETNIVELFTRLQKQLAEDKDSDTVFSLGISNSTESRSRFPNAYTEAKQALDNGYSLHKRQFIHTYRTQQVIELIQSIPENKLLDYYSACLGELAYTEQPERLELLRTLDVFLNHECSVSETARVMYVHRNTVQNRITRCEAMLRFSVKDPVDTLKMRIALVIHRLL